MDTYFLKNILQLSSSICHQKVSRINRSALDQEARFQTLTVKTDAFSLCFSLALYPKTIRQASRGLSIFGGPARALLVLYVCARLFLRYYNPFFSFMQSTRRSNSFFLFDKNLL